MSDGRFAYRLDSVLRLRAMERDALQVEAQRAAKHVGLKEQECEELGRIVETAEEQLRMLLLDGDAFFPDVQMRVRGFVVHQREMHSAKRRELEDARHALNRVLSELRTKVQAAKALENHRDRKRRVFDELQERAALHAADEQWMRRGRSR